MRGGIDVRKMIAVSDRTVCARPFAEQVQRVCALGPLAFILRENGLPEGAYRELVQQVLPICRAHGVRLVLHTHVEVARQLGVRNVQVPLPVLRQTTGDGDAFFEHVGTSVHSVAEAREAQRLGANVLVAGHVFATSCKPGVQPRGLGFLHEVCTASHVPVYAIGGFGLGGDAHDAQLFSQALAAGAAGVCARSAFMGC